MGTENPNHANNYSRPAVAPFAPPQNNSPFSSTRPVVGSQAAAFRPTPGPAFPSTPPSSLSGPVGGPEVSTFRPMQTGRPIGSFVPPTTGPFQRFSSPPFNTPPPQAPPPHASPIGQPPVLPPGMRPPPTMRPQTPPMHMGSPPLSMNGAVDSQYISSRPNLQQTQPSVGPTNPAAARAAPSSAWPGYPATPPAPVSHQGSYGPAPPQHATPGSFSSHQGGYGPAPPVASPLGMYVGAPTPPTGGMSGLVEDFSSLSIGSVPGSFDAGLDTKVLPRPLDGDVEPTSFAQMYPMNCNSRYLRLTTSAIPNSQSLVSRWHLPLGAVVCPLAEAPEGEEVPIVNFATTGIVRCRRCRTYVNPYVTFTDGGRKWRCNICALLNDVQNDYFAQLDATGKRVDLDQRPKLTKGCVEFVAPAEYMVWPPTPPLYFFLIDVSIYSVKSGMLESQLGGKLLIFQSTLPSLGVGRLRLRGDDIRAYETDKENALRISEDPFYKQMAADFTKYQVAVNVYAISDNYTDIGSLGTLAKYTGGQVYYYSSFHAAMHKDKLKHELARDLTRETAWEAVMRIRCEKGYGRSRLLRR